MLQYETVFVTEPTVLEEELEALINGIDQLTTAADGKVLKVERWGKRRLAYPIGHREEGTYVLMVLECQPELLKELERRYRMNEKIIRHQTVRVEDPSQLGPSPIMKARPVERQEAPAVQQETPVEREGAPLEPQETPAKPQETPAEQQDTPAEPGEAPTEPAATPS